MAGKGLGMGLGALFGEAAADPVPNDFDYLPIVKVEPRQDQPRSVFDESGLEELAASIKEHGVLQPLTVRSVSNGYYQIIAGERRWRAARLAGLNEVPARIIEADDKKATELAMVENLQREGLNPIEEAFGYKTLIAEYGMTQEEVAQRVGKSRPVVANALRLLSLPDELQESLKNGAINVGTARTLLALKNESDMLEAANTIFKNNLNVREAEHLVKKMNNTKTAEEKGKNDTIKINYLEESEKRLGDSMGRRVKILDGKRKGRIEIEYYGHDDFERLFQLLSTVCAERESID